MSIGPVEDHRKREKGVLVYPVYSRRSGGLSVGINLFPDRKACSFDCPYCEVFPFNAGQSSPFPGFSLHSLQLMEADLIEALAHAKEQNITVRDICFSGNGEPTQSPHFPSALEAAFRIRDSKVPGAELVLITNGTGLLNDKTFDLLRGAACGNTAAPDVQGAGQDSPAATGRLCIWLKLDAGTPDWYRAMSRSSIPFERLMEKIRAFVKCAPVTLQTMICAVNNRPPPPEEKRAWEALVAELASSAAELGGVQIYGKARPAPEDPLAAPLPVTFLEARAASLRAVLASAAREIPVWVFP